MVESLIALPVIILLLMGAVEWARIYEAKVTADHAVTVAARTGSFNNASPASLYRGLAKGLLPYYAPGEGQWQNTLTKVSQQLARDSQVRVLNPTREAFQDFGISDGGITYLPNDELHRQSTSLGNNSGLNIQDANLLKVEVTWGLPLRMPVISDLITNFGEVFLASNAFEKQLYARGQLPITSSTALRMQSPVILGDHILSIRDIQRYKRHKGGPTDQLLAGTATGSTVSANKGYQGITPLITKPRSDTGDNTDGGADDEAESEGESNAEEDNNEKDKDKDKEKEEKEEKEEFSCETNWEDPRYQTDNSLSWWNPERWVNAIKVAENVITDYALGLLEGAGNQAEELLAIIKNPGVLAQVAAAFIESPKAFLEQLFDGLVEDAETLIKCGPKDIGRIIGENLNPVVVLKIVGKLSKLAKIDGGPLAEYRDKLERQIACASFPAGTPVSTPEGLRAIESLAPGDRVYARDDTRYIDQPQEITQRFNRIADGYQRIETEQGTITTTPEHPFWVQGKGWTEAKDLEWEDPIATRSGDLVAYGNTYIDKPVRVYNFSVANTPNYFAGDIEAWVHNANCEGSVIAVKGKLRGQLDPQKQYSSEWNAHHLITSKHAPGSSALIAAAEKGVYIQDSASNGIMLPTKVGAQAPDGGISRDAILPIHKSGHTGCDTGGCVGKSYQDYVKDKLNDLDERYELARDLNEPWSDERLASEIYKVQQDIAADLLNGKVQLCKSGCEPQSWQ